LQRVWRFSRTVSPRPLYGGLSGIVVIRTLLIYAHAKLLGLVGSVQEKLDELRSHGFRLSDRHYEQILRDLGE
jgi:predicted nucleic acid-binding protein